MFSLKDALEIRTLFMERSLSRKKFPEEIVVRLTLPDSNTSVWTARLRESRQIVSMATLTTHPSIWQSTRFAEIWDVITLKEHQRNGLAESILQEMISSAQSANFSYLELFSRPEQISAHRLYEKLGFTRVAESVEGEKIERIGRHRYRLNLQS